MKIKYHICKVCGKKVDCDADVCFVADASCGREECERKLAEQAEAVA